MSPGPTIQAQVGRGVATMVARYVVVTPLSLVASVVLARLLTPADFGAFVSVVVLVSGLGSLFELGMMSVLIQQPEAPTAREMRAVFTAYALLFTAVAAVTVLLAPAFAAFFQLSGDGPAMVRWMALLSVVGVLGCIPTMRLEREMRFGAIAILDIVTLLADKLSAVGLALAGYGVWSFVWASLIAICLRMLLLNVLAPWPFGFTLDRALIGRYMVRGAWFQGVNVVSLARDNLNSLLGGPLFGPRAVGLLNWGTNLPNMVAGNGATIFQRVFFPAFAKLHDQPEARGALLASGLRGLALAVFPLLAILPVFGEGFVVYLYGEAWRPALPLLGWFTLRAAAGTLTTPFIWYLNATGRVSTGFQAMTAWIGLEWGLAMLLAARGFEALAIGAGIGSLLPAAVLWLMLRREAGLSVGRVLGPGLGLAAFSATLAYGLSTWVHALWSLIAAGVTVGGVWLVAVGLIERRRIAAWRASRRKELVA